MDHERQDPATPGESVAGSPTGQLGRPDSSIPTASSCVRFRALFEGYGDAFGVYDLAAPETDERGKVKGRARTVRETITTRHWEDHLSGKSGLGIIPIDGDNRTRWGAIDLDSYDGSIDHGELARRLDHLRLPLAVVRSKSGGVHLLMFAAEPVPAAIMIARLKEVAALLGFAGAEIFPKQASVRCPDGDVGSWINLSYYGGDRTTRYAVRTDGEAMRLPEFLNYAEAVRQPASWFTRPLPQAVTGDCLPGAPPCLSTLVQIGIGPGQRNNALLAFGTYCKRRAPDAWQTELEQVNQRFFSPPLGAEEVSQVIRSLRKKDYSYSCKTEPLASHCNRKLCLTRQFGIGTADDSVTITHIRILQTDPPTYFLNVEGHGDPLQLDLEELWDHARFQKVCIAKLRIYPTPKKRPEWAAEVTALLQQADTLPAPPDASDLGRLRHLVTKFLTGRARALCRDEIATGKPWFNASEGRYYFRSFDLEAHLDRNRMPMKGHKLWAALRAMGATHKDGVRVQGVSASVWIMPDPGTPNEPLPVPEALMEGQGDRF